MREFFKKWSPLRKSIELLEQCNEVIDEMSEYQLTLRQLYYQLVSRDIIANSQKSYSNLGVLVGKARLAGMMDWNAIEDRVRKPDKPSQFDNLKHLTDAALWSYRLPRWEGQENYVELWVEKDALASVLEPIAKEFHIILMVNRGYSSLSAMKESAERFIAQNDKYLSLLYLGDFDPSGEDMVRDIRSRMSLFGVESLEVTKLALTMDQVDEYQPPPNPVKMTDSRAREFMAKYDIDESWELDALSPSILRELIEDAMEDLLDQPMMDEIIEQEKEDKKRLESAVKDIMSDEDEEDEEEEED